MNSVSRGEEYIISSLQAYIQDCETEARSRLVHRWNMQVVGESLYASVMGYFLFYELIIIALFFGLALPLLGKLQLDQVALRTQIGFASVFAIISSPMLYPFTKSLLHIIPSNGFLRFFLLLLQTLMLAGIGLFIGNMESSTLVFIIYAVVLGLTVVVRVAIRLGRYYFQPLADLTGDIMNPKFFEDSIMRLRHNSPENGRLDTPERLQLYLWNMKISKPSMEKILARSKEYCPSNLSDYSEVPSILLAAVKQDATGDGLMTLIQETQSKDVNQVDAFKRSYLECVIKFTGNRDYCRSLLQAGADPNVLNSDYDGTVFHTALQKGMVNLSLLEEFLKHVKAEESFFVSPLWYFAKYTQAGVSIEEEQAMARLLIKHGYDVNETDPESGESVLQAAVRYKPYLYDILTGQ